jgi:hypothetical protein
MASEYALPEARVLGHREPMAARQRKDEVVGVENAHRSPLGVARWNREGGDLVS